MSGPITVSYTYSLDHFRLLLRAIRQRRRRPRWQWILLASILLLLAVLMTVLEDEGRLDFGRISQPAALVPLALVVIGLPLSLALIRLVFHRIVYPLMFKRSGVAGARVTYDIGDESIQWTGPHASGVIQWPAICAVTRLTEDDGIVLWTGPRTGILLPREAFGAGEDFDKVEKLARARLATGARSD